MSFHLFKTKIEGYEHLIDEGKHSLAIAEMEQYLEQGLQEESDVAALMQASHDFDATIKQAVADLRAGDTGHAHEQLEKLKELLTKMKTLSELVAKEEETLE